MSDQPLTYTIKGNVPSESLRLVPVWDLQPGYIKLNVQHFMGDELVRNDVYVYDKQGVSGLGVAAPLG